MGLITGSNTNSFKSVEYIYSNIKRDLKAFSVANLIDEDEFPRWTTDVLKALGVSVFKETDAFLTIKNKKACLPKDFMYLYAAYKCKKSSDNCEEPKRHYQGKIIYENDVTIDLIGRPADCYIGCEFDEKVLKRVTVKQYIRDNEYNFKSYDEPQLLRLSPSSRGKCVDDCPNSSCGSIDEISINDNCILTNFSDGSIYMLYYSFPFDENGYPMIPDDPSGAIEKSIEYYIKFQILLNLYWSPNVDNLERKWGNAKQLYNEEMGRARFESKLPSFSTLTEYIRKKRIYNAVTFFSQIDTKR